MEPEPDFLGGAGANVKAPAPQSSDNSHRLYPPHRCLPPRRPPPLCCPPPRPRPLTAPRRPPPHPRPPTTPCPPPSRPPPSRPPPPSPRPSTTPCPCPHRRPPPRPPTTPRPLLRPSTPNPTHTTTGRKYKYNQS